jgi:hypothetical protein
MLLHLLVLSNAPDPSSDSLSALPAAASDSGRLSLLLVVRLVVLSLLTLLQGPSPSVAGRLPALLGRGPTARLKSPSRALRPVMKTLSGFTSLWT